MPAASPPAIIMGGSVFDSRSRSFSASPVRLEDGVIAGTDAPDTGADVIDATGLIVTAGLVDLHTHVFVGQDAGVEPDALGARTGVTTMVDAGSSGAHLFEAFTKTTLEPSETRIVAFLNISTIGITSFRLRGELRTIEYCDPQAAVAMAEAHRDTIVGIKVRASADVGAENAVEALGRARSAADSTGLPLMVHLGPAPATVDQILDRLEPGDVLTHCFTGFTGNQVVDAAPRASVRRAYERGVLFDVGHGGTGFDATVARTMIDAGLPPHTISSDVHAHSIATLPGGLPSTMSKLLALGLPLAYVIDAATARPAAAVRLGRLGVGTLDVGTRADVAAFRLVERETSFTDGHGHTFTGTQELEPVFTIRNGRRVFGLSDEQN
ncbi:amidohydrolase/deacetylase family metallohydrolase [Plantibacter sp. YIM 135249]|uniref:amidohydrolase/deacetylase family metallohydrolase n=1 Tax=Plantibacter sp. YIM 135249 TaxID=3423918 RepID=UPI003D359103